MAGRISLFLLLLLDAAVANGVGSRCDQAEETVLRYLLPVGVAAMCEHRASPSSPRYLYIGGTFNLAGAGETTNFARYNLDDGEWDTAFQAANGGVGPVLALNYARSDAQTNNTEHFLGSVLALACPANQPYIYLGGYFSTVGSVLGASFPGQQAWNFARFDALAAEQRPARSTVKRDGLSPAWGFLRGGVIPTGVAKDKTGDGDSVQRSDVGFHSGYTSSAAVTALGCVNASRCDVLFVAGFFEDVGGATELQGLVRLNLTRWARGVRHFTLAAGDVMPLRGGRGGGTQPPPQRRTSGLLGLGNGTQGLIKQLAVFSAESIVFGGLYLAGGGDPSAPMLSRWSGERGFECVPSSLASTGVTSQTCKIPGVCCATVAGPVYALQPLSRRLRAPGGLSPALPPQEQILFMGGEFEAVDVGALISGPTNLQLPTLSSRNFAALNLNDGLGALSSGAWGWGVNGAVMSAHCAAWKLAREVVSDTLPGQENLELCTSLLVGGTFTSLYSLVPNVQPGGFAGINTTQDQEAPLGLLHFTLQWSRRGTSAPSFVANFTVASPLNASGATDGVSCALAGADSASKISAITTVSTGDTVFAGAAPCYGSIASVESLDGAARIRTLPRSKAPQECSVESDTSVVPNSATASFDPSMRSPNRSGVAFCCFRDYYCPLPGVAIFCPEGWGYYCNQTTVELCEEGFYCPRSGLKLECPRRFYCPKGSTKPRVCTTLGVNFCPEQGMTTPRSAAPLALGYTLCVFGLLLLIARRTGSVRIRWRAQRDKQRRALILKHSARSSSTEKIEMTGRQTSSAAAATTTGGGSAADAAGFNPAYCMDEEIVNPIAAATDAAVDSSDDTAQPFTELTSPPPDEEQEKYSTGGHAHLRSSELVELEGHDKLHYCCNEFRVDVKFTDLSVQLLSGKKILAGVTGRMRSQRMTAVMGPSGCGKTTLMCALSDRIRGGGKVEGEVRVNNREQPISSIQPYVGFVPQEDTMIRNLSVKENLWFYAMLRRERDMTQKDANDMVNSVIVSMGLWRVRHSQIGDEKVRGISGGQRKRVNVAIELMGRPSLLFLDEPTSGLDATSTNELMVNLKTLAKLGLNVVMVIHQPRLEVFNMIDDVLLLGVGGRAAFVGKTKDALRYFDEQLEQRPTGGINPADFFIDIISENPCRRRDGRDVLDTWETFSRGEEKVSFDRADAPYAAALDVGDAADAVESGRNMTQRTSILGQALLGVKRRHPPSIFKQTILFAHRAISQQVAERYGFFFDMWLLVFIAVLVGVVVPSVGTQFQLANLIVGLTATLSGLRIFGPEDTVFCREAFQGTSVAAYFAGKIIAHLPRLAFMPLIFVLNFAAAANPGQSLSTLYAIFFAAQLTCTTLGVFVSLVVPEKSSQVASVIIILFSVLFNGQSPTANALRAFPLGVAILDASYSHWTASALSLSYLQQFEPASLEVAMELTNKVGYSNISTTFFQAQNGSRPQVAYQLLEDGLHARIRGQIWLFSGLAGLSLIMALVVSARAANQFSLTHLKHRMLDLIPEPILERIVVPCIDAIMDRSSYHRSSADDDKSSTGSSRSLHSAGSAAGSFGPRT